MSENDDADGHEVMPSRGLDQSRVDESATQDFDPKPMTWGPGHDGLPTPEIRGSLPLAPPLSTDTFVCLADESELVLRNRWGEVVARFEPKDAERAPSGEWWVSLETAILSGAPWLEVLRRVHLSSGRVRVEPLRPQCKFLAQQMVDFGQDSATQMVERLCTARRDDERFFVGLRDTQVHACELRSPRDGVSENRIRISNETKIALGRLRTEETGETFDVDQKLAEDQARAIEEGLTQQGIFREK